jgi:gliding motility-associated-like protein
VNPSPAAPVVVSPLQLCQGQTATPLTATGTGLKWYDVANGGTALAAAPTPNTSAPGTTRYYVSQTVNGCEGPRAAIAVIVNSLAIAPGVTSPINICQGDVAAPLTANGTGSPTAPTPNTATPGNKTWYVSQVTGCGEGPRASITVNVNARPAATISYTPGVLCNVNNGPVSVTFTGTTGGTYTIVPASGLTINPTTGEINPTNATPGTYTIRYTIPGSGGCANYVTTATVTVNSTPSATIAYPAICSSDGATPVQRTGSGGGTFTSDAGLTINATTGTITPGSSTPGMHTVKYEIAPSGPCPGYTATTTVTITQAPTATIAYTPAVVCNVQAAPVAVTRTGTAGGTYSISPATGLTLNASTGEINPLNATPGTYTIKYTVTGTGGCRNFETTTTVTVNGAPTATIQYAAAPYCSGNNTPQKVTFTGTTGGTFTAPAGLSINATTGDVNASLSTPGTYTVTYTIAAALPCPGFVANTNIEIIQSPVISFPAANQTICSGQTASFNPTSTVANTAFSWAVVGQLPANVQGLTSGNVSGANPSINLSFTNTGAGSQTINVQVIAANPVQGVCTSTPYTISVTVHPLPPAPVADTFHLCMAAPPTALHVDPIPGTTIKWYDQNGVLLNAPPVINTALPAQFVYFVSHMFNNGCESPRTKMLAIVHPTAKIVGSSYTNPTSCGIPSGSVVLDVLDLNNNGIPNLPVTVHYEKFQTLYSIAANTDATGKITIPLVAGTYSGIYVETGIGCMSQQIPDIFVLKDPNPPAQPIAGYNPPICSGTPLQLTALSPTSTQAGPIDYVWAGPAFGPLGDTVRNTTVTFPSAQLSHAGTYIVYAIQNNCISQPATFSVDIKQAPTQPRITTRNPLCIGDDLVLQATSAMPGNSSVIEYTWKGPGTGFPVYASTARINKVRLEDAGIYTITAYAPATGCSASTDTLIQVGGYPIVKFPQDTITLPTGFLLKLAPVITNANEPGIMPMKNFAWTPSQNIMCNDDVCSTPVATIKNNACYVVNATNIYGCSGSDTMCVKVFCTGSQVFVPNAFAPNGNLAENTRLVVRASGIASVKSFRVFNRWGKIVYEKNNFAPNDPSHGWDGRINGRMADPGVYIYTVDVICENNVPYTYKGDVTLF